MKKIILILLLTAVGVSAQTYSFKKNQSDGKYSQFKSAGGDTTGILVYQVNPISGGSSGDELFLPTNPAYVSNVPGARDTTFSVTIDSAASLSGALDLGNRRIKLIQFPTAWTTAGLTFTVSVDGTNYYPYYVDDVEYSRTAAASIVIDGNPRTFVGVRWIKFRSGTAATPVNQGDVRTIKVRAGNY